MEKEALTALSTAAQQSAAVPSPCETAARLRAVEEALKDPANEPVQNGVDLILDVYKEKHSEKAERMGRREGNMLDIIIESHLDQAQKVNKLVLSIKKFIGKSKADDATKEKFFLDINFYVFQKLWPFFEKEGDTLSELDKSFADHLADLKAFITAKFLGFPASVTNETFTTHSLFSGTMEALKALEAPDSPYGKLQTIYKVYKNCNRKTHKHTQTVFKKQTLVEQRYWLTAGLFLQQMLWSTSSYS